MYRKDIFPLFVANNCIKLKKTKILIMPNKVLESTK